MKCTCATHALRNAVQTLHPVCPVRTTLPILQNVHVNAQGGKLVLTATDLDVAMRTEVMAEIAEEGATTIPARFLLDALRRMSSESIDLSSDAHDVTSLRSGAHVECRLRGLPTDDFPSFTPLETENQIALPVNDIAQMLRHTSYAVSKDETRYVLNGVCFHIGESCDIVATDGRRLAKYSLPGLTRTEPLQIVVPTKTVGIITQLLESCESSTDAQMRFTPQHIEVCVDTTTLISRLIDGHFPNYQQVIPKSCEAAVEVDRKVFLNAINLAAVVTEKTKQSVVKLHFDKGTLGVSAVTAEIGEVNDVIDVTYDGEPIELSFNPTYLTDVCGNVATDTITIEISNARSPVVMRSGENFLCVIMPLRM